MKNIEEWKLLPFIPYVFILLGSIFILKSYFLGFIFIILSFVSIFYLIKAVRLNKQRKPALISLIILILFVIIPIIGNIIGPSPTMANRKSTLKTNKFLIKTPLNFKNLAEDKRAFSIANQIIEHVLNSRHRPINNLKVIANGRNFNNYNIIFEYDLKSDGWFSGFSKREILNDAFKTCSLLKKHGKPLKYKGINFHIHGPLQDKYGNITRFIIANIFLKRSIIEKINYSRLNLEQFERLIRQEGNTHFQKSVQ